MTNIAIGTPLSYDNTPAVQGIPQNAIIIRVPEPSKEDNYVMRPQPALKCIAISIIVISSIYPWMNWVLWGTIIAHIGILPIYITISVFSIKSCNKNLKYSKYRVYRAVVVSLGTITLVWLASYFIMNAIFLESGLEIFMNMMVVSHFILTMLMVIILSSAISFFKD